jgi:hypothetical protein
LSLLESKNLVGPNGIDRCLTPGNFFIITLFSWSIT